MTFSTLQVSEAAQVSRRQLQWWDERRVIQPTHEGHRRVYDVEDFFKTLLIARMRSKGVSLQRIRACVRSLPVEKVMAQEDAVFLVRRKGMRICNDEVAVRAMDLENGPVWVVAVAPLLQTLRSTREAVTTKPTIKRHIAQTDDLFQHKLRNARVS